MRFSVHAGYKLSNHHCQNVKNKLLFQGGLAASRASPPINTSKSLLKAKNNVLKLLEQKVPGLFKFPSDPAAVEFTVEDGERRDLTPARTKK